MSTTPSALLTAIGDRLETLSPDKNNPTDGFHRVRSGEPVTGRDRMFRIQLDRGPSYDGARRTTMTDWCPSGA
jgi:hypothetical protein